MKRLILLLLTTWTCAAADPLPITFPDGYDGDREVVLSAVARAQGRIDRFAAEHGWEDKCRPFAYDSVEIYRSDMSLADRVRDMYNLGPDVELPGPPVAGCEKRVLMAVSPEAFERLRPDQTEPLAFEKLLAHEIGHRLHVEILDGNEDAMGPRWFYEGFAVVSSGQLQRGPAEPSEARILMDSNSYESYGKLLRLLLTKWDMRTLVLEAGKPGFEDWILAELSKS